MTYRKAKIICTIGPVSAERKVLDGLVRKGMNVARLNFSHGSREFHQEAAALVRELSALHKKTVAIMQDLQGIKIRVGTFKEGFVTLKRAQEVKIRPGKGPGDADNIYINYPRLLEATEEGDTVLLNDGLIELKVVAKERDLLRAKVKAGGLLKEKKGVNLPGLRPVEVSFTEKDRNDLRFGISLGIDYVALSFVRTVDDVLAIKDFLKKENARVPVIAKIETPQGLQNIDGILEEADGIMVARGDLGVEIPPESVPLAQKVLIEKANRAGKIVIVATEMLESMTERRRPTRAETTDVSNAVIDGADALMLSQETSIGQYPVEALETMDRIILRTERTIPTGSRYEQKGSFSESVARAAAGAAQDVKARYIVAFTQSGYTARLVSMLRPTVDIIAFSPSDEVVRKMALYWGVLPRGIKMLSSMDALFREVEQELLNRGFVRKGDTIVITAGTPNVAGTTNIMKLDVIGG